MLPRARIRRLYEAPIEEPAVHSLKLRPFTHCFQRGRWQSPLLLEGRLRGTRYGIRVDSREILLLEISTGTDPYGPFVLVKPQEHALGTLTVLRIEADAMDGTSGHAAVSYAELASDLRAREQLAYAERWFSVYFNPRGLVDGTASGGPESIPPPVAPS